MVFRIIFILLGITRARIRFVVTPRAVDARRRVTWCVACRATKTPGAPRNVGGVLKAPARRTIAAIKIACNRQRTHGAASSSTPPRRPGPRGSPDDRLYRRYYRYTLPVTFEYARALGDFTRVGGPLSSLTSDQSHKSVPPPGASYLRVTRKHTLRACNIHL